MSLGDSGSASTSGRSSGAGRSAAPPRGFSSLEDSWDADDGGYTPFPSNLPTAPSQGEAWRSGRDGEHRGGAAAPSGVGKQSYELWQYTNSLHYSTADAGDLWRTLTNVRLNSFGALAQERESACSWPCTRIKHIDTRSHRSEGYSAIVSNVNGGSLQCRAACCAGLCRAAGALRTESILSAFAEVAEGVSQGG